jgi:uncharacterized protein (TIGR02646 family)
MRHIQHNTNAPPSLAAEFRRNPHPTVPRDAWEQFDSGELRAHLWDLQFGLCAYCERVIEPVPGQSSIEHIIPKTQNPGVTFQYTNLVLCCIDQMTCNLKKKGQYFGGFDVTGRWSQGFVAPTQPRCETSFEYKRDGSIRATDGGDQEEAIETIRILNLDHGPLETERANHMAQIEWAVDAMSDQLDAVLAFLRQELSLGALKPFYSAKNHNFRIPV